VFQGDPDKIQYRLQCGARENSALDGSAPGGLSAEADRRKKRVDRLIPRPNTVERRLSQTGLDAKNAARSSIKYRVTAAVVNSNCGDFANTRKLQRDPLTHWLVVIHHHDRAA